MQIEEDVSSHHLSKRTTKHHGLGIGSSCTVKGSYCSCHYCRCDMGFIHCVKHGATSFHNGIGSEADKKIIVTNILWQGRTIATATWRVSTASATTASANTATVNTGGNTGAAEVAEGYISRNSRTILYTIMKPHVCVKIYISFSFMRINCLKGRLFE